MRLKDVLILGVIHKKVKLRTYWKRVEFSWATALVICGSTVSMDLVSVKPMDGPSSNLFYMDYKYGNTEPSQNDRQYVLGIDPI